MCCYKRTTSIRGIRANGWVLVLLATLVFAADGLVAAAKSDWPAVATEELSNNTPVVESDVFAEAISYKIEINDDNYPDQRSYKQYVRFKIYEPERAESILSTRLFDSANEAGERKGLKLKARLTLPNGSVTEFDDKSFVERTRKDQPKRGVFFWLFSHQRVVKDRMLIISGVEKGAVLEYQLEWKQNLGDYPELELWPLQFSDVPIRLAEYEHRRGAGPVRPLGLDRAIVQLLNSGSAKLERGKDRITVVAKNVSASLHEPFLGPASDYTLMVMNYSGMMATASGRWMRQEAKPTEYVGADGKKHLRITGMGPWAILASWYFDEVKEQAKQTKQVRELAAEITKGATKELEKATRLHNYVVGLRQKYLKYEKQSALREESKPAKSPDEVIEFTKKGRAYSGTDFLMLGIALNRAAGLDAHMVILPDRTLMRFDLNIADPSLIQAPCVGIRIDGRWYFSSPHTKVPIAFNMLPAWNEGQVALVAWEAKQEFIRVPLSPSSETTVRNLARLKLDGDGTLSGTATTIYSGHTATSVRIKLDEAGDETEQKKVLQERFLESMPGAVLEIKTIKGLENPEEPVEIVYSIKWEGYASFTKDMFLLRPSLFRPASDTPFPSEKRRYIVSFPFHWQEFDDVYIETPEGYKPEAPSAPPSMPGKELNYKVELSYAAAKRILVLKRQFASNLAEVPVHQYKILKSWYDDVSANDSHEVAFKKIVEDKNVLPAQAKPAPATPVETPSSQPAAAP